MKINLRIMMIDRIKEYIFLKYEVDVPVKHIALVVVLIGSIILLILTLLVSSNTSKKTITPKPNIPVSN